jgi:G:T-mismatch repair DNA endonuclease (very short patch repair protein)
MGWKVLRIWEHELKLKRTRQKGLDKITLFLYPSVKPTKNRRQ